MPSDSQDRTAGSDRPVGSVADEAARLADAVAAWSTGRSHGQPPDGEASGDDGDDRTRPGGTAYDRERGGGRRAGDGAAADDRCPECGQPRAGRDPVCRICPICQGIALLRSVRPETVDRLADLAAAVADSLRAVAEAGRDEQPSSAGRPGATPTQDIRVDDEEGDGPDEAGDPDDGDDVGDDRPEGARA